MSGIALRTTTTGALRRLIEGWRRLLLGIGDGIAAARRYERLAALSDAELARAGLTRTDLPWLAFSGQRPTPPAPPRHPDDVCQPPSRGGGRSGTFEIA